MSSSLTQLLKLLCFCGSPTSCNNETDRKPLLKNEEEHGYSRDTDRLSRAATIGDINALRIILSETTTIGIDEWDSFGSTALCQACIYDHYKIAKLLLELGASPNQPASDGNSPVHLVCQYGNEELLVLLSRFGADLNARNASNKTPMHIAVETGHDHIVECLVEMGAFIPVGGEEFVQQQSGESGEASSVTATPYGASTTASSLLSALSSFTGRGRSFSSSSSFMSTAASHSSTASRRIRHGKTQSMAALPHQIPQPVPSPIIMACAMGSTGLVQYLLDNLPDELIGHVSSLIVDPITGHTMLATTCENGHVDLVDFLLSNQYCSVSEQCRHFQWTPLHHAAANGHSKVAHLLITKYGANIDAIDRIGRTPLHHASARGHWQTVQVLIELGANVDIQDDGNQYPDCIGKRAVDLAVESIHYHRVARAFRNAIAARKQDQSKRWQKKDDKDGGDCTHQLHNDQDVVQPVDITDGRNDCQGRSRSSSTNDEIEVVNAATRGSGSEEITQTE